MTQGQAMRIPFFDFTREASRISSEIEAAFHRVLVSGRYILGQELDSFEKAFAKYCSSRYALGVASGTDALFLALKSLGIGPGDEVITVANTFAATALAILYTGATPVFVDIEKDSFLMDSQRVEDAVTKRTRAIIPVHLYGQCADMDKIRLVASKHGLFVVEDACQAHGALYKARPAGSLGDVAAFSFYPTKNLSCYGDGGMVVTNDKVLYERLFLLRNYGQKDRYHYSVVGYNSRLDEIQAAVLRVKLGYLDRWTEKRLGIARKYDQALGKARKVSPRLDNGSRHAYHLYVAAVSERDNLMSYLRDRGIETMIHYPVPLHRLDPFKNSCVYRDLENTEKRSAEILSLPMNQWLEQDEVEYIADSIRRFYA